MSSRLGAMYDQWSSRAANALAFGPLLPASAVSVLLAYLSTGVVWVRQYGAFGWASVGLVSFVLFSTGLYILALARERWAYAATARKRSEAPDYINPVEREFTRRRVTIEQLKRPSTNYIEDKIFTDCEILGPAIVMLNGGSMSDAGLINCNWVVAKEGAPVFNGVMLKNITIRGGSLHDLTIIVPESLMAGMKSFPGFIPMNRTGDPQIDQRVMPTDRVYFK